ncbi:MAG: hypothetical protein MI810_20910 [Flavobacteriales bacterium]|nr:hypothetical protein [Flavobacteriales bacterium]
MIELGYPCPEDVTAMPKTNCGHYCQTCSKDLIDFRNKSAEETKEILMKDQSIKCGIFRPDQMKNQSKDQVSSLFRIAFAAIFVLGFNLNVLFGQSCGPNEFNHNVKIERIEAQELKIDGRVFGIDKTELEGAEISYVFNETRYLAVADENGYFDLEVAGGMQGKNIEIMISYGGMESEMVFLTKVENQQYYLTINLSKREYVRGKIAVPGMIKRD